ncbi:hypothetical protein KP509_03G077900 [Ceratopteris richardii]|uniref:CRAL-TRIO domain-containing protein n=1 Tax=Ceratopteris richardii TaxID=49495 RepID=A0A8T2V173_CERRI|nr:hypothetical protein KP509_03G077900 [Ceratopteris richardii]
MREAKEVEVIPPLSPAAECPSTFDCKSKENVVTHEVPEAVNDKAFITDNRGGMSPPKGAPPVSLIEESCYMKDLIEFEKKALEELKARLEEAICNKTLYASSQPATKYISMEVMGGNEEDEEVQNSFEAEDKQKGGVEKNGPEKGNVKSQVLQEVAAEASPSPALAVDDTPLATKEVRGDDATSETSECTPSSEPEAVAATVGESPTAELHCSLEEIKLWGIPLLHSKGDKRTDVILLKFLRARDFKVDDAMIMLKNTLMWRKEFNAESLVDEEFTKDYESVAYMHGYDKEGHPVCYNLYGVFQDEDLYQKTFGDDKEFKKFLRWRIHVLEKGIQRLDFSPNGVQSMVQITDFKDSPGFVKHRYITKKVLTLLQDNYPELVAKQIFINVPWYFGALYSLLGKIMTPRSKSKVVIARPDKVAEVLFKYISPEHVPLKYGGFSRSNDSEFDCGKALVKELTIKVGEKQTIELSIEKVGSVLLWDVTVVGWGVMYGEEFVPSGENVCAITIQKLKKMAAVEEPQRNSFKAMERGKLVLTIDNISRKKKTVVYRHILKEEDLSAHL